MSGFLKLEEAGARVGKSTATIYRWVRGGHLKLIAGHVREADLLQVDRLMASRRGRPPKRAQQPDDTPRQV